MADSETGLMRSTRVILAALLAASPTYDPGLPNRAMLRNAHLWNRVLRRGEWMRKPGQSYQASKGSQRTERYRKRIEAGLIPEEQLLRGETFCQPMIKLLAVCQRSPAFGYWTSVL